MAKLKTIQDAVSETIQYIRDKRDGKIRTWKCGFPKTDDVIAVEYGSTVIIGGRPSIGKSAYSDCMIDGAFETSIREDGTPDFTLYDCNWELSTRVQLLRRLSSKIRKTYKHIVSAEKEKITEEELEQMESILIDHYGTLPIVFSEEPESVKEWEKSLEAYLKVATKPTVVRVDHTLLAKKAPDEKSQLEMLFNLLAAANRLKKKYPVIFIFLTQLNREFEDRQESNSDKAFPRQSDVYGGDPAAFFSETMLLLNKPSKYGIEKYGKGPSGVVVQQDDLFVHIVKNRNGAPDAIVRMKENFKYMTIREF